MGLTLATVSSVVVNSMGVTGTLVLCVAVLHDLAFRTIPNWIPGTLCLTGGLLRIVDGSLIAGLLAGVVVLVAAMFCWRRGWLGGGDVKLIAACTLMVPPALVVSLLLDVALCGGALALLYLVLARLIQPLPSRPRPASLARRILRAERYRICRYAPLPYASAIAAGVLIVMSKG